MTTTKYVPSPPPNPTKLTPTLKIAILYLTVLSLGFLTYLFSTVFVYTSEKAYLASAGNTRDNTDDSESALGIAGPGGTEGNRGSGGLYGTGRRRLYRTSSAGANPDDPVQVVRDKGLFYQESQTDSRREGGRPGKRQLLI